MVYAHSEKCPECAGRGRHETGEMENGIGGWSYQTIDCAKCSGTGEITDDDAEVFGYKYGTVVKLRGEFRIAFYEHEGDHVIIWWLPGDEATNGPADASDTETNDIYAQLWSEMEDRWAPSPEDDRVD